MSGRELKAAEAKPGGADLRGDDAGRSPGDSDDPLRGGPLRKVWAGATAALYGPIFALRHPHVALHTVLTMALYFAVWGVLVWQFARYQSSALDALLPAKGAALWQVALWNALLGVAVLVYWLLALLLTFVLANPLVAPALGLLAERVEDAALGGQARPLPLRTRLGAMASGVARAAALAALQIGGGLAIWALSLLLSWLLPPLGAAVALFAGGAWSALWLATTLVGYAMENHHIGLWRQIRLLRGALPLMIGFGACAQLFAWLPLAVPILVVSATLLAVRLHRHGHLGLPLRSASSAIEDAADAADLADGGPEVGANRG